MNETNPGFPGPAHNSPPEAYHDLPVMTIELVYEKSGPRVFTFANSAEDEQRLLVWVHSHPKLSRLVADAIALGKAA